MDSWLSTFRFQIISWILAYNIFGISLYFILLNFQADLEQTMPLRFWPGIMTNIISGLIMGIVLGGVDILLKRISRRKRSFISHFLHKSLWYMGIFLGFVLLTAFFMQWVYKGLDIATAFQEMREGYVWNIMLAYVIFTASTSVLISFLGHLRQLVGPNKLSRLFWGRYFSPRSEERIFMFLDLKDSTAIAEKLGHVKYSQFIQDCFFDLNQVVPRFQAEIYQYVGDEAVLHWPLAIGTKNQDCLYLFRAFQQKLESKQDTYIYTYGLQPTFKAGLHAGSITVAEVGEFKKEIAYHGDVLNTAARLEKACALQDVHVLVSDTLTHILQAEFQGEFISVGQLELKGKAESIEAFTVVFPT